MNYSPAIGVLGAQFPEYPYVSQMGVDVGYLLRKFLPDSGVLFTGGVSGVGEDAYQGIINYCLGNGLKEDRFFVLVPKGDRPSDGYYKQAKRFSHKLEIIHQGETDIQRQEKMAEQGEVFVVVNGGYGTLNECVHAIIRRKKIIVLPFTGGTAEELAHYKIYGLNHSLGQKLSALDHHSDVIDSSMIEIANSIEDLIKHLETL
jgi:predicted Rossmann-fold nucleotide-binding protein